jgi:uncharacterized protein (TIGR03437 family)
MGGKRFLIDARRPCFAMLALVAGLSAEAPLLPAGAVVEAVAKTREAAPGALIRIGGRSLAAAEMRAGQLPLPEELGGVTVSIEDEGGRHNAALLSVSPSTIEAQIPYAVTGSEVRVRVKNADGESAADVLPLAPAAPRLLTSGSGVLAVLPGGMLAGADRPAEAGGQLTLYATGLGPVDPPKAAGEPGGTGSGEDPLNWTRLPVQVLVGGLEAPIDFVGLMPGSAGAYQINCTLPEGLSTGLHGVRLLADGRASQAGLMLAVANAAAPGREFYVSPSGTPDGDGSRDKPWDLGTALRHPAAVRPGDTIWMLGGNYGDGKNRFESVLAGAPGRPIILRQAKGHRASIQGGLVVRGEHAWYWGFEVTNSFNVNRQTDQVPFSLDIFGPHTKFINMVVHDTGQGFGFWLPAVDAEIYGSLSFYNGFKMPDRGHGHGIYTQNREGVKLIHDNIVFQQFGVGLHAYGSSQAWVEGYDVRGNVVFQNGFLAGGKFSVVDNILFGVGRPLDRIVVEENFVYNKPEDDTGYSRIGWSFGPGPNGKASIRNNYFMGGQYPVEVGFWNQLTFTGNVTYSKSQFNARLDVQDDQDPASYSWDGNTHYGPQRFLWQKKSTPADAWKQAGVDRNSRFQFGDPSGVWSFVRPNKYEPGRANIIIYNWDKKDSVPVDVSKVLKAGTRFEVRDAQDFYGKPVLAGLYEGGELSIPMAAREPMRPVGENLPVLPQHTLPQFGAFILITPE